MSQDWYLRVAMEAIVLSKFPFHSGLLTVDKFIAYSVSRCAPNIDPCQPTDYT